MTINHTIYRTLLHFDAHNSMMTSAVPFWWGLVQQDN
jgi:hypothetical protein